ncbi:Lar family restriction alleviation protein [uncultured Oscillibacter sp.]|uniref:Lar family restriction alleviation protein n=1 Tax=uncultured Oscillibacter sp. TaxID=876091 RepID=UPI0025DEBC0D|nr:Lar family restriction alleviation protein [uncultured Oscillibacter sp.]
MDPIHEIELEDCPICRGAGLMQEEQGWCMYAVCMDCGAQTAQISYNSPEERLNAAQQAAQLWNMGKVVHTGVGD